MLASLRRHWYRAVALLLLLVVAPSPIRGTATQQWSPESFEGNWYIHKFYVQIDAIGRGHVVQNLGFDQDYWWEIDFQLFTGLRDTGYGYVTAARLGAQVSSFDVGVSAGGFSTPVTVTRVPYGGLILNIGWQHLTFVCRSGDPSPDGPLPDWYKADFCPTPA